MLLELFIFQFLDHNMYQAIIIKNNQLSVHWFKSQSEAYDFISKSNVIKYKIYNPNEIRRLDLLNAFYWDEEIKDFNINLEFAKEIIKNHYREIRSILFQKLDTAFLKALETNNVQQKEYIINLKTQFRNVTDIDLPNTETELLNYIPSIFKEVYDLVI